MCDVVVDSRNVISGCLLNLRHVGSEMERLEAIIRQYGQNHLLEDLPNLNPEERQLLLAHLETINYAHVAHAFGASMADAAAPTIAAEPVHDVVTLEGSSAEDISRWQDIGLRMIAHGKLGVLLLAGGQGTRLGSTLPKGCYNIGLPSRKSLFQIQAERLAKLQKLAAEHTYGHGAAVANPLRWYIMTSGPTDAETKRHFAENAYFGLNEGQIFFFQQGVLPALTEDGKIIMESVTKPALSPDGNGGVYPALAYCGVLEDMRARGIKALDCYCVDNALARVGDPIFAGMCAERDVDCGARVVAKAGPEEKVGVFATRDGSLEVVEYSELDPEQAAAIDEEHGRLKYNWANICMHYFSREWLQQMADAISESGRYHVAHKKIPSKNGPVAGIKLELFIFDAFPKAKKVALMEVSRRDQFAPVKNAPGSMTDSPDTAREAIMRLHRRWVEAAGGRVEGVSGVEVAPLVSYAGEGLEKICTGKTFKESFDIHLQGFLCPPLASPGGTAHYASPRPEPGLLGKKQAGGFKLTVHASLLSP